MTHHISDELLNTLSKIPTPAVANGLERFDLRPRDEGYMDGSVHCRFPGLGPMVGYAVTAKLTGRRDDSAQDFRTELWKHTQDFPGPSIVVIEDVDDPAGLGSFWGEVNANVFKRLGCLGIITNGGVRDLPEMEGIGFHAFSSVLSVSHAYNRIIEVGGPVTVGGMVVEPGDLLHADEHGVVKIPLEAAEDLPQAVRDVEAIEKRTLDLCASPDFSLERLLEARRAVTH
jgi:regulator of RNase E activity RraA